MVKTYLIYKSCKAYVHCSGVRRGKVGDPPPKEKWRKRRKRGKRKKKEGKRKEKEKRRKKEGKIELNIRKPLKYKKI